MWAFIAGCSAGAAVGFLLAMQMQLNNRNRYDEIPDDPLPPPDHTKYEESLRPKRSNTKIP